MLECMIRGLVVFAAVAVAAACGSESSPSAESGAEGGVGSSSSSGATGSGTASSSGGDGAPDGGALGSPDGATSGALTKAFVMGVNAEGMEIGDQVPGTADTNYALIHAGSLDKYHAAKLDLVRLPIKWARMQPIVSGDLNQAYVDQILTMMQLGAERSMSVILDVHNYGRRDGHVLGDGTLTSAQFADLWSKIASAFRGKPGVGGFDLMNEPHDMPSPEVWPDAAQAAIDAIRAVDPDVVIYVEGQSWASADRFAESNPTFPLHDPSHRVVYSGHAYGDKYATGVEFDWDEQAAQGVTTETLAARVTNFATWCDAHRVPCHIGEIGVANNHPSWNVMLDKALAVAQAHEMRVTYWAAGPWWGDYPMSVESADAPQMTILKKYSGAP